MQTRFYDSAEPGPPHGWLDADQGIPSTERPIWENTITIIQQTARNSAVSAVLGDDVSSQICGCLHTGCRWWIYHIILADEDRFGRPGRTLSVLFCSTNKDGFDWAIISAVGSEIEALAKNRNHLSTLLHQIDNSPSSSSLTDSLFKQPSSPLLESSKQLMSNLLHGLGNGQHEYFTISRNGSISNRGHESITPKALGLPQAPGPVLQAGRSSVPANKPRPNRFPLMKPFMTHFLCLVIGLLVGFGLHWFSSPKPTIEKPHQNQLMLRSDVEAISYLRAATDYFEKNLGRRSESLSPGKPQNQPQRSSSTPQNPSN